VPKLPFIRNSGLDLYFLPKMRIYNIIWASFGDVEKELECKETSKRTCRKHYIIILQIMNICI
jgi:hypothetical protein